MTRADPAGCAAPAATVVIPTYNGTATLPRALASIEAGPEVAEILVIDDASADAAALHALAAADPRVTVIAKETRSNAAHSRAIGLERARGEIVLFLDADDHYLPGHIARRCALHRREQAAIVIGRFRLNDGAGEWDGPMTPYDGGDVEAYIFARGGDARSSTISVLKPVLRGTTFDARLAKHQDWGFVLAAWRNGERIVFDPEAGAVIDIARGGRMSAHSDVEASLAFARDALSSDVHRRHFLIGRLRTSIRIGDLPAARRFRGALLRLGPGAKQRWATAGMILAARAGLARPLHRLLTARR